MSWSLRFTARWATIGAAVVLGGLILSEVVL